MAADEDVSEMGAVASGMGKTVAYTTSTKRFVGS